MIGTCRLNNKSMRNIRRNEVYQCLAIDLAMLGVISKEECEMLIGSGIPKGLVLPNGKQGEIVSEEKLPEKPDFIHTEPVDESPVDESPVDESPVDESPVDESPVDESPVDESPVDESPVYTEPEHVDGLTDEPIDDIADEPHLPVSGYEIIKNDESQDNVNDEGRTESDN